MALDVPCPQCGTVPPPPCGCPPLPPGPAAPPPAPPAAEEKPRKRPEVIKLRREKRGGNREVIVLEGFPKGGFDMDAFARELKRRCGTGGTVKGFSIEIRGDHRATLEKVLLEHGFRSKRAGG